MKKAFFWIMLPIVFLGGCTASIPLSWKTMEPLWIRNVSGHSLDYFFILTRSEKGEIEETAYPQLTSSSNIVTPRSSSELDQINQSLWNLRFTGDFKHAYFKILEEDSSSMSVSLELPTLKDSMSKYWYRIEGGRAYPQKVLRYGPGFAFVVIPLSVFIGLLCTVFFYFLFKKIAFGKSIPSSCL